MNKILVMYYSKNGSTKQYAEWIAEGLNADLRNIKNVKSDTLSGSDVIVLASPLLGGPIKGLSIFAKNQNLITDKKIIYCACGIEDMGNEMVTNRIRGYVEKAVPAEVFQKTKIFFLRGGFDHYKLNFMYRFLFWVAKKKMDKKPVEELSVDEKLVALTYGKKLDFSNKDGIKPVLEYCGSVQKA
jgi:flavodoxin